MRIALLSPIEPGQRGNGSAQRAAFWRRTLAEMGELTTIIVPILGRPPSSERSDHLGEIVVEPTMELSHPDHPSWARFAPRYLGARLATEIEPFDLVVAFKSYLGPFAVGLVAAHGTPLAVDLDDDDAALAESVGDRDTARRFRHMIDEIRPDVALMFSAQGIPGTVELPNVYPVETPPPDAVRSGDDDLVLMVGNLTYGPNFEGARWLADEVWPLVLSAHPTARLVIAGLGSDGVEHGIGFVPDLSELYRSAALTVAPIHHGSGTRIKILESWVQEVPVVSTAVGIDGLAAVHGEHALIASDAASMAEQIVRLLGDPALRRRLAVAGSRHVRERFDPETIGALARRELQRVVTPPVGPRRIDGPVATEVDDGLVVDDEHRGLIHHLDPVAAIVYSLCDGEMTSDEMASVLGEILGAESPADADRVTRRLFIALDQMVDAGLVTDDPAYERIPTADGGRFLRVERSGSGSRPERPFPDGGRQHLIPDVLPTDTIAVDVDGGGGGDGGDGGIGWFSARMIDAGAMHVVVLEPHPDDHRLFQINLAAEIESGRVEVRRLATGGPRSAGRVDVDAASLDELIDDVRSRHGDRCELWLKVGSVDDGSSPLEAAEQLARVDVVVVEIHGARRASDRRAHVVDRLVAQGFTVEVDEHPHTAQPVVVRATRSAASAAPSP